jgi:hypothetical protein
MPTRGTASATITPTTPANEASSSAWAVSVTPTDIASRQRTSRIAITSTATVDQVRVIVNGGTGSRTAGTARDPLAR